MIDIELREDVSFTDYSGNAAAGQLLDAANDSRKSANPRPPRASVGEFDD